MTETLRTGSWKEIIPSVYGWAGTVAVGSSQDLVEKGHHVVAVKTPTDAKDKFTIESEIAPDIKKRISDTAQQIGWTGKNAPLKMVLDGKVFVLVPLSRIKAPERQVSRQFGRDAARALKDDEVSTLVLCRGEGLIASEIFEGFASALYNPGFLKGGQIRGNNKGSSLPGKVVFLGWSISEESFAEHRSFVKAQTLMRMLQDAPANWLDPTRFAEIATDIAGEVGIRCTIKGRSDLEKMGAGAFLSVAAGSPIEPKMITLEIDGHDNSKCIALVGKGLTFDTGGNSIKPGPGMHEMKYDMSGGAAVLAAACQLAQVKPPIKVVCVIGAVENMPGGSATRPGDIVMAMNGKTIDVMNTDAEGRLVLADCLHYANTTFKPSFIVNIATLTGACLHALGHVGGAVMSNDDQFAESVLKSAKAVSEPFWQLPLWPEFEKEVKAEVSDLQNIAKPSVRAGTIMGGMFLKEFVGNTPWAHLDVAGTAWSCKALGYPHTGGSGFAIRTLVEICRRTGE